MGIPICTYNSCCEKNNVILQTHSVYRKENSSKIKSSNSKSGINKSIIESISQKSINSISNSISNNESISENKSDEESDNEDKNKQFSEKLYKTGILRNESVTIDGKNNLDCIFVESYNKSNNFFYYLKNVILIQKFYKKYYQKKKVKKKKSKKLEFGKLHVKFNINEQNNNNKIDQESNLFYNISKTKLSFANLMTKIQTKGTKIPLVPFNLNSKRQIKYRYYGQLSEKKKIENYSITPEIKITQSIKSTFSPKKQPQLKSGYGRIEYNDKSTFQGIFSLNKANGIGHYQDNINGNFIGEYLNNEPNGYGIYNNGGLQVEGNYNGNYLVGIGIERSDDDTKYEGEFSKSTKNGIGTFKWSDGTIYKGNFVNNEMTGFGIIEYNDGKLYQGEILNGTMNGYGEFYWSNGKRYFGNYKNDKRNGFGIFIWVLNPLECYVGFFENGLFNGVGIKISGDNVKYGIWKRQEREKWFKGPWEFENHIHKKEYLKYMSIFQMKHVKLFEYINNISKMEIFCSEDNQFFK
jgi:hypothetical protein